MDIRLAREFGYRIKLIGQAREALRPEGEEGPVRLEAGVFPALVYHKYLLARVGGVYNAIRVEGNASGPLFFHGRGAGDLPTGRGRAGRPHGRGQRRTPQQHGFAGKELPKAAIVPPEEWRSCYYVRVMVEDTPGVLRDLSGCMAAEGISLAQVIQKSDEGHGVPLVFMTHETTAKAMSDALQRTMGRRTAARARRVLPRAGRRVATPPGDRRVHPGMRHPQPLRNARHHPPRSVLLCGAWP